MPSRFLDNGDGTITDVVLGTMWQKEGDGEKRTCDEAIAYSEALDLGGRSDWRLPNRQELMKLGELGYDDLRRTFPNIKKERYWVAASKSELAWAKVPDQIAYTVDFDPGMANCGIDVTYFRHYTYYVRCIRAVDSEPTRSGLESRALTGAHRRKRVVKAKPSPKREPTLGGTTEGWRRVNQKPPLIGVPLIGWMLYPASLNHLVNFAIELREGKVDSIIKVYSAFTGLLFVFMVWVCLPAGIVMIIASGLGLDPEKGAGVYIADAFAIVFAIVGLLLAVRVGVQTYRWRRAGGK